MPRLAERSISGSGARGAGSRDRAGAGIGCTRGSASTEGRHARTGRVATRRPVRESDSGLERPVGRVVRVDGGGVEQRNGAVVRIDEQADLGAAEDHRLGAGGDQVGDHGTIGSA